MLDLLIDGGLVVDGSGAPGRRQPLGIRDGAIVLDPAGEPAARSLDATGLVVAPGFVDIHTHYDAQLQWDPFATPSPLHGTTTVIGGNCGFGLAPVTDSQTDYLMRMMSAVEGIPLAALQAAVRWDWPSFGAWLDQFEGQTAINTGFLVGHSTIRLVAMGEAARSEPAGADEQARILAVLHEALAAGGLGFSTSLSSTHSGADGRPVPSRFAAEEELFAIAEAVGQHPGTTLEMILSGCVSGFQPQEVEFMTAMSRLADRPLNWNTLRLSAFDHEFHLRQLAASDWAAAHGGGVYPLTMPHRADQRQRFQGGVGLFSALPGWDEVWEREPDGQPAALLDPDVRTRLRAGTESAAQGGGLLGQFARLLLRGDTEILEASAPEVKRYEGRLVSELAKELDRDPFDLLLELAARDGLQTWISRPYEDDKDPELWPLLSALWRDPRTVFGGSDAGAHVDQMVGCVYTTGVLANGVRKRGLISLEEAVHQLTDVPARLYGLRGRGRIADGWQADLVLFDPDRVAPGRERIRADLPGGARRLYSEGEGIQHVFVNGVETVREGSFTGNLAGRVLRSGRDTETVSVSRLAAGA